MTLLIVLTVAFDLLLALGATLRLTRFVVADDVPGTFWIKEPLHDRKHAAQRRWVETSPHAAEYRRLVAERERLVASGVDPRTLDHPIAPTAPEPRWARYLDGLACPFCMSVWFAGAVTVALMLAGGPGDAADWWRWGAGFLTLAWVTGHLAARAGDTED